MLLNLVEDSPGSLGEAAKKSQDGATRTGNMGGRRVSRDLLPIAFNKVDVESEVAEVMRKTEEVARREKNARALQLSMMSSGDKCGSARRDDKSLSSGEATPSTEKCD